MRSGLFETFILLLILALLCYLWLKHYFSYWKRHNVPEIQPTLIIGNLYDLLCMKKGPTAFVQNLYNHPDAVGKPFVGIHLFHKPAICLRDPNLIKRVMVKDFPKFSDRYSSSDAESDPMGSLNIFFLKNPRWKDIRSKLTPFFTSGKIKKMFYLIEEVGRELNAYLLSRIIENANQHSFTMELKELCALYTTDVIATVAYGVKANSFKSPNGDFRRNGREVFQFSTKRALNFVLVFFLPRLVGFFGVKIVPPEPTKFLRSTINYVIQERENSGETRNDLIDILIEFKNWSKLNSKDNEIIFEGDILVAQAAIFFTAGFESSSSTMSFALYELAKHTNLQQRLRDEVHGALREYGGKVTQALIDSLEFMSMVINEVLRMYPPLPFLDRECTLDKDDEYSLEPFNNFAMPNGMPVIVPVYAIHMDPKVRYEITAKSFCSVLLPKRSELVRVLSLAYYPNPHEFNPERFSAENRNTIDSSTYMPFGLGPHGCIGERFGKLQIKIGLVNFLRNHYVTTCERTHQTLKFDPKAIILQAENGIYLNVVRDPLNI